MPQGSRSSDGHEASLDSGKAVKNSCRDTQWLLFTAGATSYTPSGRVVPKLSAPTIQGVDQQIRESRKSRFVSRSSNDPSRNPRFPWGASPLTNDNASRGRPGRRVRSGHSSISRDQQPPHAASSSIASGSTAGERSSRPKPRHNESIGDPPPRYPPSLPDPELWDSYSNDDDQPPPPYRAASPAPTYRSNRPAQEH